MTKTKTVMRKYLVEQYGQKTASILLALKNNQKLGTITKRLKVSVGTVAAVKANCTRGVYAPWAITTADNHVEGSAL